MKYDFDRIIDRKMTDSVKWDLLNEEFGTTNVLPMWVADMDFEAPPEVTEALATRTAHAVYGYPIRPDSYFESIRYWLKTRHGWEVERSSIISTPGIVPALAVAVLAYTSPGDSIVLQPPVYHPFYSVIEGNGRKVVTNNLKYENGNYTMDFEDLKAKITKTTKMIILCNPHNPVGRVWKEEELQELGKICIENNIIVISDEIHSDIIYRGNRHVPFASLGNAHAEITVTCMAPSKTFNIAGLATSYTVIPSKELRERFTSAQDALGLGMGNLFGISALEAAYVNGERWLTQLLEYLEGNFDYMVNFVNTNIPEIHTGKPDGTYLGWLDCRQLDLPGDRLKEFMINRARIGLSDGRIFGEPGAGFMRINLGCPRSMLVDGLNRIYDAVTVRNR